MGAVEQKIKKDNHSVTQSNHLIRAAYDLSLNEKRLIMLALTKVNPERWKQDWEIEVHASEWASVYGKELKHSYGEIENAANQLEDRKIFFSSGPDVKGKKTYESGRWVAWAKYLPGEGKVSLEIPKGLRKYLAFSLLEDDGFTTYRLLAAAKLRSPHAVRLYELLMQWKSSGTLLITVDDLRECLMLQDKYKVYADLKKWVINPSIDDINASTDYQAAWDVYKKAGRKITSLKFTFTKKKQKELDFGDLAKI